MFLCQFCLLPSTSLKRAFFFISNQPFKNYIAKPKRVRFCIVVYSVCPPPPSLSMRSLSRSVFAFKHHELHSYKCTMQKIFIFQFVKSIIQFFRVEQCVETIIIYIFVLPWAQFHLYFHYLFCVFLWRSQKYTHLLIGKCKRAWKAYTVLWCCAGVVWFYFSVYPLREGNVFQSVKKIKISKFNF